MYIGRAKHKWLRKLGQEFFNEKDPADIILHNTLSIVYDSISREKAPI